ncbi:MULTISPECIES: hypothetical protein [Streptomyces]|uniref:Uncharacterized protein n=1 Tax=Streptomyces edwardsiae TaxID=3075527 RepID=A0ABU2Q3F4_9ACTN|nr:hypothetical protein [Streptomyces sp. DSM 41636]MDT0398953.1 hypothetical protein [Streptomyces sp. DSM 41636]
MEQGRQPAGAGDFGFEKGHDGVSMACADAGLLPAVREADDATLVLADGFSCRTQVDQAGVGRTPLHLVEILAAGLHGRKPVAERPASPRRRALLPAAAAAVALLAAAPGARRVRVSRTTS